MRRIIKRTVPTSVPPHDDLPAYALYRSDRRSMCIEVLPPHGSVVLRVSKRTSICDAEAFLRKHLVRVRERIAQICAQPVSPMDKALSSEEAAELRAMAVAWISERVAFWTSAAGLPMPDKITYTTAQKRFGACRTYPDGRVHLSFSVRLMLFPRDAVDAVVLHEVAHIVHMNHSPAFYTWIAQYMPDYKERHAVLVSRLADT
ncbi:MAG: DUF45 domain-containing protein [Clostridia bacterium]|nr:DUF45 domain-containing protein [Clostridia bacterium]